MSLQFTLSPCPLTLPTCLPSLSSLSFFSSLPSPLLVFQVATHSLLFSVTISDHLFPFSWQNLSFIFLLNSLPPKKQAPPFLPSSFASHSASHHRSSFPLSSKWFCKFGVFSCQEHRGARRVKQTGDGTKNCIEDC